MDCRLEQSQMATAMESKTFNPDSQFLIPELLRGIPHWVVWKSNKLPVNPHNGKMAKTTASNTWADFETAVSVYIDKPQYRGIGYVFSDVVVQDGHKIVGVDLDKCRDSSGNLDAWAMNAVNRLNSYTEISPSGNGVHVLTLGDIPASGRKSKQAEFYKTDRYFTVTAKLFNPQSGFDELRYSPQLRNVYREFFQDQLTSAANTINDWHVALDGNAQVDASKLAALMGADDKFRDTWNYNRQDKPDWSASEYCLSLARVVADYGWSDQEITNLVICWRQYHGLDLKLNNPSMYYNTIVKARTQIKQQSERAARDEIVETLDQFNAESPDEISETIIKITNIPVTKIIQEGKTNAVYTALLKDGSAIFIGKAADYINQNRWRHIAQDVAGRPFNPMKGPKWQHFLELLATMREVHDHDDTKQAKFVADVADEYIKPVLLRSNEDRWQDAAAANKPFVKDNNVYIHAAKFYQYLQNTARNADITLTNVVAFLREAGWARETVSFRNADSKTSRSFWSKQK